MRAGTNSHILVLKQWCLAPAFGCDAQRALRRVVALGPHIPVLLACFSVSLHHGLAVSAGSAPVTDTALLFLCAFCVLCGPKALRSARRVHGPCAAPDTGTGGSPRRTTRLVQRLPDEAISRATSGSRATLLRLVHQLRQTLVVEDAQQIGRANV